PRLRRCRQPAHPRYRRQCRAGGQCLSGAARHETADQPRGAIAGDGRGMSYAVFTGDGGYVGWRLLSRTAEQQKARVAADPQVAREAEHFRQTIGQVSKAEDLVADYRLLSVALKAHGLEADIGNRAFIRKVLESDLSDPKSLANRLSDSRYAELARSFGFSE